MCRTDSSYGLFLCMTLSTAASSIPPFVQAAQWCPLLFINQQPPWWGTHKKGGLGLTSINMGLGDSEERAALTCGERMAGASAGAGGRMWSCFHPAWRVSRAELSAFPAGAKMDSLATDWTSAAKSFKEKSVTLVSSYMRTSLYHRFLKLPFWSE